eukprot:g18323.t1
MVGVAGRNKAGYEADLSGTKYVYLGLTASQSYQIFVRKVAETDAVEALANGTAFEHKGETYTVRLVSRTLHHQKTASTHAGIIKSTLQELRQEVEKLLEENDDNLQRFRFKPVVAIVESEDEEEEEGGGDHAGAQQPHARGLAQKNDPSNKQQQPTARADANADQRDQRHDTLADWWTKKKEDRERWWNQEGRQQPARISLSPLVGPGAASSTGANNAPSPHQHGAHAYGGFASSVDSKIVKPPTLTEDRATKRDDVVDIRLFNVDLDSYVVEAREYYEILRHSVAPTTLLYNLRTNIKLPSLVKAIRGKQYSNVEEYLTALEKAIFPGQNSRKFADWLTFTSFETKPETLVNDLTEYERVREKVEKIPATEIAGLNLLRSLHKEVEPHQLSAILTRIGGKFEYENVGDGIRTILADKIVPTNTSTRGDALYYTNNGDRRFYRPESRPSQYNDRGRNYREDNRDQQRDRRSAGKGSSGYRGTNRNYDRTPPRGDSGRRNDQYPESGPSRTYSREERGDGREQSRRQNNDHKGDKRSFSQGSRSQNASRSASNSRHGSASRHTSTERVQM